jgi:competence protein ComEC
MPLLWLSLAFLSGILLAANLPRSILGWTIPVIISLLLLLPPVYRRWTRIIPQPLFKFTQQIKIPNVRLFPFLLLFISLGAIRYLVSQPVITPAFIAYYNDQPPEFILEGVLIDPPDNRDKYTNLRLQIERLRKVDENQFIPVNGLILARVSPGTTFLYGDRISLQGHLVTPSENEDFSYRDYLAIHAIYSFIAYPTSNLLQHGQGNLLMSALYSFRQHALDIVYRLYPDPEAGLIAGILLGDQSGISPQIQEAFRLTGTSHIIVISGFNITIIAALFTLVFSRILGVRRGVIVSIVGIIIYTLLVGANPAVVRAAILGILALFGHQIGRSQVGLNSLIFVAAIMAVLTPTVLWDVSFQLSFAATLGIMLYAETITHWFTSLTSRITSSMLANRLSRPASEYLLLTLAAQLTTLPLMIYYFKRISLTSIIANPLILPAQPPLMIFGGLSILAGLVLRSLGQVFAWAAWPFTAYTIRVVEWLAEVPHGSIPLGQVALPMILLFYMVLFIITFFHAQLIPTVKRLSPAIPLIILGVVTIMVWKTAFYAPDDRLHVTILNVGTGDAVLIQSPTGRSVLINGGPSTLALSDALGRRLPPLNRTVDWLVVADIDDEDLMGITANLERFLPANVLWAGNTAGTRSARDLQTQLIALGIPITSAVLGQSLDLGLGANLQVLFTDPKGADLLLVWGNFRQLLPMGTDFTTLESLQINPAMRNISALLLAESGYAPLNPPEFISFLHPQLALLSIATADRTGLPSPETLQTLQGYNLLRTDHNGWIELITDGKQMWVEVEQR